ncbi:unnamed protein product [Durusdinium trenchii]|uniref:Transmembrane protein n=2 Tax=Durusdinium trenchii TaxID=1381693 RepID=A0ABP0MHQ7_9DINO
MGIPPVHEVPVLATILHLVVSEWCPIWLFFIGHYSLLTDTTAYLYLWYTDVQVNQTAVDQEIRGAGAKTLGEYVFCVQNEVNFASWTLNVDYHGHCLDLEGGYNLLGIANYFCLFICCSLVASSVLVVLTTRGTDICTGKYLATKWDFEKTRLFRSLSILLLCGVLGCFLVTAYVSRSTLKSGTFQQLLQAWLFYGSVAFVLTLVSAYALLPGWSPRFNYQSNDFQRLRFKRTWRHVFWSSSESFARDLEEAILLAGCGSWKRLRNFLEDPTEAQWVLDVCKILDDDDDTDTLSQYSSTECLEDASSS